LAEPNSLRATAPIMIIKLLNVWPKAP
jgi:hypothetical protein